MTTNHSNPQPSQRRSARRTQSRTSADRRLTVRSEQRENPDVRKIALAILTLGRAINGEDVAEPEAEADE